MTDGASDIIALYELPTDAYTALKAVDPNHELCALYEEEWPKEERPGIITRFARPGSNVLSVILAFHDAMRNAVQEAKGRRTVSASNATQPVRITRGIFKPSR